MSILGFGYFARCVQNLMLLDSILYLYKFAEENIIGHNYQLTNGQQDETCWTGNHNQLVHLK